MGRQMSEQRLFNLRANVSADTAREPASARGLLPPIRAHWQWLRSIHEQIDDSLLGDAIGTAAIVITACAIFIAANCLN